MRSNRSPSIKRRLDHQRQLQEMYFENKSELSFVVPILIADEYWREKGPAACQFKPEIQLYYFKRRKRPNWNGAESESSSSFREKNDSIALRRLNL